MTKAGLEELTARELEVLVLMSQGLSNPGICEQLFLGRKTVETHVRHIYMKLGLQPRDEVHRRVLAVVGYRSASSTNAAT